MKWLACVVALSVAGGTAALAADFPPPVAPSPATYIYRSLRLIPITGPASISAAISALVLITLAAATDTFGSTFGTTANTSFLGGGQVGVNYELWSFLRHRRGGHVRLAS